MFETIHSKDAKQLKKVDKEKVSSMSDNLNYAVRLVIETTVKNEVISYLHAITPALKADSIEMKGMFDKSSPILAIQKTVYPAAVESLVKTCNQLSSNLEKLNEMSKLDAQASQSILVQWQKDSRALLALFEPTKASEVGAEKDFYGKLLEILAEAVKEASTVLQASLQGNVHSETAEHVVSIVTFTAEVLTYEDCIQNGKEDTTKINVEAFDDTLDKCCRLTSVLGQEGKSIRNGLAVLESAVKCSYGFAMASPMGERTAEKLVDEHELDAMQFCFKAFSEKTRDASVKNLACLFENFKHVMPDKLTYVQDGVVKLLDGAKQKAMKRCEDLALSLKTTFESAQSRGSKFDMEMPDAINNIADMTTLTSSDFQKVVQSTFPSSRSSKIVELAVELEGVESSIESICKETQLDEKAFAPWADSCKTLRRRFLSWLSCAQNGVA